MRRHTFLLLALPFLLFTACGTRDVANGPTSSPDSTATPSPILIPVIDSASPTAAPTLRGPSATPSATATATPFITPPASGNAALIPLLMYHHLRSLGPSASAADRTWTVSPEAFASQLDYLKNRGYHTITLAQLVAFFRGDQNLPLHPVLITFDDDWMEGYTVAFPVLLNRGMIATFFVPVTYADAGGKSLMDWAQISEMDAAGMEIGSHTINHANLKQVSPEEAIRQITYSKAKLEQKLGHTIIAFSYPFGAVDAQIEGWVRQAGYEAAVGLCCGYKVRATDLLLLPRIRVSYDDTLEDFARRLPPMDEMQ